ncbi:hypothetical protein [Haloarchaeobius sp. DYHT-AS-18]|uniref:hypothetical protein n=1 Tax=Haloarchaeobius sp. DYHT-AS-18 TaxID=3446117 RepID=UPI003EB78E03
MGIGPTQRRAFLKKSLMAGGIGLVGTTTATAARELTVDKDDPDAYDRIQRAVAEAPDGATIHIAGGTYEQQVGIPSSKSLTLRGDTGGDEPGAGPDAPVIDGGGVAGAGGISMENTEDGPSLTIEGVVIRNFGVDLNSPGQETNEAGAGIQTGYRSNVTIRDVSMDHIVGSAVAVYNGGRGTSRNWTVERCRFDSIAHTAINLSGVSDSVVRDNVITASDSVPDAEGNWWEQNTPDGNPVNGIRIQANAQDGRTSVSRNVTVAANEVVGRFDISGIKVFSHNYSGAQSLVEQVTIRDNTVELTSDGDDDIQANEKHGIILDANGGPDWSRAAAIRDVTIEGNRVTGANHAYKFLAMSSFTSDSDTKSGVRDVVCRDNEAVDCGTGCIPLTTRAGDLADVTVEENRFENCQLGVNVWSRGRLVRGVTVRNNEIHRDVRPDEYAERHGIQIVGYGADIEDIQVTEQDISKYNLGVVVFGVGDTSRDGRAEHATVRNVVVTDCTISNNDVGMLTWGYDDDSTLEATVERTTFEANERGVTTRGTASGDDLHVHHCNFLDHTEVAATNESGNGVVDATCNFWGHPTGPTTDGNNAGRGERVGDGVDYDPLLPQRFERVSEHACHPAPGGSGNGDDEQGNGTGT